MKLIESTQSLLQIAEEFHREQNEYRLFPLGSTKNRYLVFDRDPKSAGAQMVGHIDKIPDQDPEKVVYWAYLLLPGKSVSQQRVGKFKSVEQAVKAMEKRN